FYSQKSALLEDLDLQLFSALEAYNLALNAYKISQIALKQAEENYRISKNRYEQRILSTSDFLDAELLLSEAKMNLILNKYAIVESLAQLERITQTTLMQK
ncbi:MAG: TolC family protein, partial [Helicobacter sp.]|nr:TolC family protein [Helicobacter sp.]